MAIVLAFANERGEFLPELAEELRQILRALKPAEAAGHCKIIQLPSATFEEIAEVFREHGDAIGIFHFSGHASESMLQLQTVRGRSQQILARNLAAWLAVGNGLQLVFLNACSTRSHVQGLFEAGVPGVLATSEEISDRVAKDFARHFYQYLAAGQSPVQAYEKTSRFLQTGLEDDPRRAYRGSAAEAQEAEDWPWDLVFRDESARKELATWTLAGAANDHLWGLPQPELRSTPPEPYKNLRSYTQEDAAIFFGRSRDIRRLYDAVTGQYPIILLQGASGVGKSSLLAAGLLPRLEIRFEVVYKRRDETSQDLCSQLREALGNAADWRAAWREREQDRPLVVILDQAELAWDESVARPAEPARLASALREIFATPSERPRGTLILSFRKELSLEYRTLLQGVPLPFDEIFLQHLDSEGIQEAVAGPQRFSNYRLEIDPELPARIAHWLLQDRKSAIAPTLQILLAEMWEQQNQEEQTRFTVEQFQQWIHSGEHLFQFFDRQLGKIHRHAAQEVDSGLVLDLLSFHTGPLFNAKSRVVEELRQRYGEKRERKILRLTRLCQDHYLLADPVASAGRKTTRLAHDILAPIVYGRFKDSQRPGQRAFRLVRNRGEEWKSGKRGAPLDEPDLATVEQGLDGMRSLYPHEEGLVAESRNRRARNQRTRWTIRLVLAGAALAIVFFALQATYERRMADLRRLAAVSANQLDLDLDRALLLGLEAYRQSQDRSGWQRAVGLLAVGIGFERDQRQLREEALNIVLKNLSHLPPAMVGFLHGHEEYVREVEFDDLRHRLFSRSIDGLINLWDLEKRARLSVRWLAQTRQEEKDDSRQTDEDPQPIAVDSAGGLFAYSEGRCVKVRSLDSWTEAEVPFACGPEGSLVRALAFARLPTNPPRSLVETSVLISAWMGGPVVFWDTNTWERTFLDLTSVPGKSSIWTLDVQPGARWLAIGGTEDQTCQALGLPRLDKVLAEDAPKDRFCSCLTVLDLGDSTLVAGPVCAPGGVNSLAFHPKESLIAAGWSDRTIRIWNYRSTREPPIEIQAHTAAVTKVRFHHAGDYLASAAWDSQIKLWETETWAQTAHYSGHPRGALALTSTNNREDFASGDASAQLILWSTTKLLKAHEGVVAALKFSEDGQVLISGSHDGSVKSWNTRHMVDRFLAGPHTHMAEVDVGSRVNDLALLPDREILATADWDGRIKYWSSRDLKAVPRLVPLGAGEGVQTSVRVRSITFDPEDHLLIASAEGPHLYLHDLQTDQQRTFQGKGWLVQSLKFGGRDREVAAITDKQERLMYWRVELEQEDFLPEIYSTPLPSKPGALAVSRDGQQVAVFTGSHLLVYGWRQPKPQVTLTPHPSVGRSLAFHPSGSRLAAGYNDGVVIVWDLESGQPSAPLRAHDAPVQALAYSSDGYLASGDDKGYIAIWGEDDLTPVEKAICEIANRNLTRKEWSEFLDGPYRKTCPDHPEGGEGHAFSAAEPERSHRDGNSILR